MKRVLGLVACAALLATGLAMASSRAAAALQVPEDHPGLISLWTDSLPLEYDDIDPGESVYIRLDVQLAGADRGDLDLQLTKSGDLAGPDGALEIGVERCDVPWTSVPSGVTTAPPPSCASNQRSLVWVDPDVVVVARAQWALGEVTSAQPAHLMVTLTVPSSALTAEVEDRWVDFAFGLFAEGVSVATPVTPTRLALTGMDVLSLALIAIGAIGAGIIVTRTRRSEVAA
jgi:hypothetical protein